MNTKGEMTVYEIMIFAVLSLMAMAIISMPHGDDVHGKEIDTSAVDVFLHSTIPRVEVNGIVMENLTVQRYIALWANHHGDVPEDIEILAERIFHSCRITVAADGDEITFLSINPPECAMRVHRNFGDVDIYIYIPS